MRSAAALVFCVSLTRLLGREVADERCELGETVVGGQTEPGARDVVEAPRKRAWEAALGGKEAARPHVMARLAGWPQRRLVDRATLPRTDAAWLARLAADTWRGLDALTDRESGLPVDHVRLGRAAPAGADAAAGDYTNVTSVGLRMIAIVAARDLGLVSHAEAYARLRQLLDTLGRLETHAGFFFNYYDTTSLERTSNLVSFVDSSWLTAALVVVRQAFPEIALDCTRLIERGDYRFFYDPATRRMRHGYYVHRRQRSRFHYGVLYAESRLGSVIGIGKGDVPAEHWFAMVRTFPPQCAWQSRPPASRRQKTAGGHAVMGGWYEWEGLRYVPSWGGSMFEALMPTLVLDELAHAPESLGRNGRAHVEIQRRWATETLGLSVWGMSPSWRPDGAGYGEYGIGFLGSLGYPAGAVTPHASALALAVAPDAAIANLRRLVALYDLWGEYGLYDAVDPRTGEVAPVYLNLDQAMTFIALANHLADHAIQRHFAADPITRRALPVLAAERFFE